MSARTLVDRLIVACVAALAALALYASVGGGLLYYGVWIPTVAVALYYITTAAVEGLRLEVKTQP